MVTHLQIFLVFLVLFSTSCSCIRDNENEVITKNHLGKCLCICYVETFKLEALKKLRDRCFILQNITLSIINYANIVLIYFYFSVFIICSSMLL
jgi:hypothetical protein